MSNKNISKSYTLSISIIFLTLMLIFSYIEAIFPLNVGGVGIKTGLSNILTIMGIKILNTKRTLIINMLRLIILGLLFGNVARFIISSLGFFLSFIVMVILLNRLNFSIIVSSIFGAIFHNIGQIIAVFILTKNSSIFSLVPIYVLVGFATGFVIGIITNILYKKTMLIMFD